VLAHDDELAQCRATVTDTTGQLVASALGSFRYLAFPAPNHSSGDTP
jgi:hypothetical protein